MTKREKKNNKIKIDSYCQNLSPPVNPFNRDISHILQKDEYIGEGMDKLPHIY